MSQNQFFEGPEKKLEITFEGVDLSTKPRSYWDEIVGLAQAKILSTLETADCKAFLLSESSLFVWPNRLIMITCGTTKLIKAAEKLQKDFKNQLTSVFFERKNEYQPELQKSFALDDMTVLHEMFGGEAYRFGRQDDHHLYLFNRKIKNSDDIKIPTVELLMYGLRGEFKNQLIKTEESQKTVNEKFSQVFKDFDLDPFFFDPLGYSLNGLKNSQYLTIHVTPQGEENYFSFEMDQFSFQKHGKILSDLIDLCDPVSFDLIYFTKEPVSHLLELNKYQIKQEQRQKLQTGYNVLYKHYYDSQQSSDKPVKILGDKDYE